MAVTTIKSTYSLDPDTVRALERMARRWKVSKSEALRRAIRATAELEPAGSSDPAAALDRLQESLSLTPAQAARWQATVRAERRATLRRREDRAR